MKTLKIDGNNGKRISETILVIGIATILMLIGIYYLPWIIFLYPIPFIVLGIRYGINYNIIGLIISTFSIGLMIDKLSAVFIFLAFMPLSISLNYTIKNRKKPLETLIISTLVLLTSFLLIINIMDDMTGISVINQLEQFFTQTLNSQIELLKEMEVSDYEI